HQGADLAAHEPFLESPQDLGAPPAETLQEERRFLLFLSVLSGQQREVVRVLLRETARSPDGGALRSGGRGDGRGAAPRANRRQQHFGAARREDPVKARAGLLERFQERVAGLEAELVRPRNDRHAPRTLVGAARAE